MRKVRIGNDINVRWEVKTDGQAVSLEGKALKLYVRSAYRKEEITTFTVEGCVVSFTYPASMQRMTGARAVILEDVTEGAPRRTVCADQAFILVAHSCEENDDDVELEDFMVSLQSNVLIGKPGLVRIPAQASHRHCRRCSGSRSGTQGSGNGKTGGGRRSQAAGRGMQEADRQGEGTGRPSEHHRR